MSKAYDFDVTFTCRHNECDDNFKVTAINKIQKLSRFHSHIIDSNIIVDKKNSSTKVEISLRVPGLTLLAAHEDFNQIKALDLTINKTKAQLKKMKSKVIDHRGTSQRGDFEVLESEELENSE